MIKEILYWIAIVLGVWISVGFFAWLFCWLIFWNGDPKNLMNINPEDGEALIFMTILGPIAWFAIFRAAAEESKVGRSPLKLLSPRYKSKKQRFLEKLES